MLFFAVRDENLCASINEAFGIGGVDVNGKFQFHILLKVNSVSDLILFEMQAILVVGYHW